MPVNPLPNIEWPYFLALQRLALALALGFFVGLERERRGKEAGVRTFAFAGLIGCFGGLLGDNFAILSLALIGLLVLLLTIHALSAGHGTELTTSSALIVICYVGILCGQGHTLTPTAVGVATAALLTWKEPLADFSLGLTNAELRSAILLGILAFIVYPALPDHSVDPWALIEPKAAWVTVILIAAIGFGNYVLLRLYGVRAIELTAFFGGVINSTVTVTALATRVRENQQLAASAYRGVLLATAAMLVRNAGLLVILAPPALITAAPALGVMLAACLGLVWLKGKTGAELTLDTAELRLQSPFSLSSALKFGVIFLVLEVVGSLAQRGLGSFGYYGVSLTGGFVSSASTVASAGSLAARGVIPMQTAAIGTVLASLTSALVNLPMVARVAHEAPLTRRLTWALSLIIAVGAITAAVTLAVAARATL